MGNYLYRSAKISAAALAFYYRLVNPAGSYIIVLGEIFIYKPLVMP